MHRSPEASGECDFDREAIATKTSTLLLARSYCTVSRSCLVSCRASATAFPVPQGSQGAGGPCDVHKVRQAGAKGSCAGEGAGEGCCCAGAVPSCLRHGLFHLHLLPIVGLAAVPGMRSCSVCQSSYVERFKQAIIFLDPTLVTSNKRETRRALKPLVELTYLAVCDFADGRSSSGILSLSRLVANYRADGVRLRHAGAGAAVVGFCHANGVCPRHAGAAGHMCLPCHMASVYCMQGQAQQSWVFAIPRVLRLACGAAFVLRMWGEPVLLVEPRLLWPFGRWFSLPHAKRGASLGAITAVPWVVVCRRTSAALMRAFFV
jgi:hypothetical protein